MRPSSHLAPAPAPSAAVQPCTVLVLRSLDEPLAKRYALDDDGKVVKHSYQNAFRFMPEPVRLRHLKDLERLLLRLERDPYACLIRGELLHARSGHKTRFQPILRRLHATQNRFTGEVEAPDLCAHPEGQPWLMVDLDGVVTPDGMDVLADPLAAVAYARSLLPEWLAQADCVYQWSASAGSDAFRTLRLHLFFWLAERRPDRSLERYFDRLLREEGLPVDPAVCRSVQIHYTAAPIFDPGVPPFIHFTRTGMLAGATPLAHPPAEILTAQALQLEHELAQLKRRMATESRAAKQALGLLETPGSRRLIAYARGALTHFETRLLAAPAGTRHYGLLHEAMGLAKLVAADLLDGQEVLDRLLEVGHAILVPDRTPQHADREIRDIWDWVLPRAMAEPFRPEDLGEPEPSPHTTHTQQGFEDAWRDIVPLELAAGRAEVQRLIGQAIRQGGAHCIAASPSLGKSYAAIEEAVLPLAIEGKKVKLLLPSNQLLDEKRLEILTHAERWLERGDLDPARYNDLVDLIQKLPTRNSQNCENFLGYQAADRITPGGGKRYCAICDQREACAELGFLKQAKSAQDARVLLTTPHLETLQAGQEISLWDTTPPNDEPLAPAHREVVILWQKIAHTLCEHGPARYVPRAHRSAKRIELDIELATKGGFCLDVEPDTHFAQLIAQTDVLDEGEDLPEEDDADNPVLPAPIRYRWSSEGRDLVRRWFIAAHGGWGGAREELTALYQNPDSWEWELLVIDEDPLGAMHATLSVDTYQLTELFRSGALVAPVGVQEVLTSALAEPMGDDALAKKLRGLHIEEGIFTAKLTQQTLAQLTHAARPCTQPLLEALLALVSTHHTLDAAQLSAQLGAQLAATGGAHPTRLAFKDEVLLEHQLLGVSRLLGRCMAGGWTGCRVGRTGLHLAAPPATEQAWERILKGGHPARMRQIALSLPDWRVAPAIVAAGQSASSPFEGCWTRQGQLHLPQVRRLDTTQSRCVLYLDGTADPVTAQAVAPHCRWHPVVLKRPESMQLIQIKLPATWQKITESPHMMRRWIGVHALAEASHPGQVLHITHKRLNPNTEKELTSEERGDIPCATARALCRALAPADQIIHHGASLARGSNKWELARAVVVDAWRVPQNAVVERARVLERLAGVPKTLALASARFALEGQGVIQEIHRARPLLGDTTIFLLDNRELPGLVPDTVWDADELDLVIYQMTGHLPHHHTPVTCKLLRQAVMQQGGVVLGEKLLQLDEPSLQRQTNVREGLSQGFWKLYMDHLPPSPSRLNQAVRRLVEERLAGSWRQLASALDLECVSVGSSLQNREVLLLMPPEHHAGDVLRLMQQVEGWSWCRVEDTVHLKHDPTELLDRWLRACTTPRWDQLEAVIARSTLVRQAKEAGEHCSHSLLSAAMRALGVGVGWLRQRWCVLHLGGPAQLDLSFEQRHALEAEARSEEYFTIEEASALAEERTSQAAEHPVHTALVPLRAQLSRLGVLPPAAQHRLAVVTRSHDTLSYTVEKAVDYLHTARPDVIWYGETPVWVPKKAQGKSQNPLQKINYISEH